MFFLQLKGTILINIVIMGKRKLSLLHFKCVLLDQLQSIATGQGQKHGDCQPTVVTCMWQVEPMWITVCGSGTVIAVTASSCGFHSCGISYEFLKHL